MVHNINIEGIKLYAYHGCLEEEAKIGGHYVVDVYMTTNFSRAATADDLSHTIDYCAVYETVKAEMKIRSKLIEHAGQRIFDALKSKFPDILSLHLRLTKITPPISGDVEKVSVEIKD